MQGAIRGVFCKNCPQHEIVDKCCVGRSGGHAVNIITEITSDGSQHQQLVTCRERPGGGRGDIIIILSVNNRVTTAL